MLSPLASLKTTFKDLGCASTSSSVTCTDSKETILPKGLLRMLLHGCLT